jgi:hypothetical protein
MLIHSIAQLYAEIQALETPNRDAYDYMVLSGMSADDVLDSATALKKRLRLCGLVKETRDLHVALHMFNRLEGVL